MIAALILVQAVPTAPLTYAECAQKMTTEYERSGESAGDVATAVVVECSKHEGPIPPDSLLAKLSPEKQREILELQKSIRRDQIIRDIVALRAMRSSQ